MRIRASLLALVVAACGTLDPGASRRPAPPPGVVVRATEHTYPVEGLTHAEISRSMRATGRHFRGTHTWRMRWNYQTEGRAGTCQVARLDLTLESVVTVPRWSDRSRADPALVLDWDRYIAKLRAHEDEHRRNAYDAARDVRRELRRMRAPCATFNGAANRTARAILQRYKELDRAFDERTRHGAADGVRWPPRRGEGG